MQSRKIGGVSAQHAPSPAAAPTAPAHGDFIYNGGPVIAYPIIYASFWGSRWSDATHQAQAARLIQFLKDLIRSDWMNILTQYGSGTGTSSAQFIEATYISNVPATLTDAGIHTVIQSAINGGIIPEPPPNNITQVLMIFLDEGVEVDDTGLGIVMCAPNGDTAFGYHYSFVTAARNNFYYAVIPALDDTCIRDSCPTGGCSLSLSETQEQRRTQVASHEFAEMVTDPNFPTGWYGTSSDEIGDICNGETTTITVGTDTWNVQRIYSKTDDINTNGASYCLSSAPNPIPLLSGGPPIPPTWHHNDLTNAANAPIAAGDPCGYMFDAQGTQHVDYRGTNGHIYELWWDSAGWNHNDLTTATAAPAAAGDPCGYMFVAQGTQHVDFRGADGHIHELWWDSAGWHHNDLTTAAAAPAAVGDPCGYMFVAQGTQHVDYRGADGHIHELWWDSAGWHHNDLTAAAGAPAAAGDPCGYVFIAQGTQHVDYRGTDGHIHELWWDSTGWHHNDLTAAAGAPAAAGDPCGYVFIAQGTQHIDFRGADGHIHELWWDSAGWHHNDLTPAAAAPAAASDPCGYVFVAQGTQHVDYRGTDHNIYELWWNPSAWHYNDLTTTAGGPAANGDPCGYMFVAQGTQHVDYRGIDGHIHELWWG